MANPNGEAPQDVTWRDAWDAKEAINLLTAIAELYATHFGDYCTANELLSVAAYIEQMQEYVDAMEGEVRRKNGPP